MIDVVERTAGECFMPLTVGGGIRSVEDIRAMLKAGADKVSINTSAVQNPDLISAGAERFGNQCIVVAIDARRRGTKTAPTFQDSSTPVLQDSASSRWEVFIHGGRTRTD